MTDGTIPPELDRDNAVMRLETILGITKEARYSDTVTDSDFRR